ncbi:hypothetical protein TSUD_168380 [Trifolium subterraneum]|nr:hypothetical protein TSUD_168380 [Trifolium subterraneum]
MAVEKYISVAEMIGEGVKNVRWRLRRRRRVFRWEEEMLEVCEGLIPGVTNLVGVATIFIEGGIEHLRLFKGLVFGDFSSSYWCTACYAALS